MMNFYEDENPEGLGDLGRERPLNYRDFASPQIVFDQEDNNFPMI
jgi:hypothetical protein